MSRDEQSQELRHLEISLLQTEFRRNADAVAQLLADEFVEFGSSGRSFNKLQIIEALATEQSMTIEVEDLKLRWLADNIALVTYRSLSRDERSDIAKAALRCSIWISRDGKWQIVFHQGTASSPP